MTIHIEVYSCGVRGGLTSRGSQTSQGTSNSNNKSDPRYKDLLKEKKTSNASVEVLICASFILHFLGNLEQISFDTKVNSQQKF